MMRHDKSSNCSGLVLHSWKTTFLQVLECLCHDETADVVPPGVDSHLSEPTWHQLADVVFECFWDGRIEALGMLKKYFPLALIHLCL